MSSARATARRRAQIAAADAEQTAAAGWGYDTARTELAARIPYFDAAYDGRLGPLAGTAAARDVVEYRDYGHLDSVVDAYDDATRRRFLPRLLGPNRFPAKCATCPQHIPAGKSTRGETPEAYLTWCSAHIPTETQHPPLT